MSMVAQIVILMIVLACMVMVLLGIKRLTHYGNFDDAEETLHLKDEVEEDGHILTKNSIFNTLVDAEPEKVNVKEYNKSYKRNSKDPLSPSE